MFILFVLISPILAIKFQFVIPKREIKCFTDNLGSDIMVTGAITANSSQYSFKIFNPNRKFEGIIHDLKNVQDQKFSFTTNATFHLQSCVHNLGVAPLQVNLTYYTGADAFDFTQIAQKEDLQPLEQEIQSLKQLLKTIKKQENTLNDLQSDRFNMVKTISNKILLFSLFTLSLMVVTTLFQSYKVKSFLKSKKII